MTSGEAIRKVAKDDAPAHEIGQARHVEILSALLRIASALELSLVVDRVEERCGHPLESIQTTGTSGEVAHVCGDCGEPVSSEDYVARHR